MSRWVKEAVVDASGEQIRTMQQYTDDSHIW